MPRRMDLTDQVYGDLKVIKYAGKKRGRVAWECECKCKKRIIVTAQDLRSGHTTSCKCGRKGKYFVDLTGKEYGFLKVIKRTENRSSKGSIMWQCECTNCGRLIERSEDALVYGHNISCGCRREEQGEKLRQYLHFYHGTCLEFLQRKQRVDNTSGHTGIYKRGKSYRASIMFMGKKHYLGAFQKIEEAISARKAAEEKYFQAFIHQYEKWIAENEGIEGAEPFVFQLNEE